MEGWAAGGGAAQFLCARANLVCARGRGRRSCGRLRGC